MHNEIHKRLIEIENAYYDGASYKTVCNKIIETAELIAALDEGDADRSVCEVYAPLLWGSRSGATIELDAVKAALKGPDRASHLQSWSGMARVLVAYRIAA